MYCSADEFKRRFGNDEFGDLLDSTSPDIDYESAASDADSRIDSYLAVLGRKTPVADPVPRRIVELAADMTRYELYEQRPTNEVAKRFDAAIKFLEDLVAGKVAIPEWAVDDGGDPVLSGAPAFYARRRTFTDETLDGFVR